MPARAVENLLAYSEDFSNAAWTKSNASVAVSVADPNGGTSACTLTATSTNGYIQNSASCSVGDIVVNSVWIRRRTGTGTIQMYNGVGQSDITSAVTAEWKRITPTPPGTETNTTTFFRITCGTSGDEVDLAFPQMEITTGRYISLTEQDSTIPSEYVATTTAAASQTFYGRLNNTVGSPIRQPPTA
jgi:hypothetical protein